MPVQNFTRPLSRFSLPLMIFILLSWASAPAAEWWNATCRAVRTSSASVGHAGSIAWQSTARTTQDAYAGTSRFVQRNRNTIIMTASGAAAGAGTGAYAGMKIGAAVGAGTGVAIGGVGAIPGSAAGAQIGLVTGAVSGGFSGACLGFAAGREMDRGGE